MNQDILYSFYKSGVAEGEAALHAPNAVSYDIANKMTELGPGDYTVTVQAKGPVNWIYTNGLPSDQSNTRTVVKLARVEQPALAASGLATWSNVPNATWYKAILYKNNQSAAAETVIDGPTGHNFLSLMRSNGPGEYLLAVSARGTALFIMGDESVQSLPQTVQVLAQVGQPSWNGDSIQWTNIANESGYEVVLLKDGVVVDTQTVSADTTTKDFSATMAARGPGTYTATVRANGSGLYLDAPASAASAGNVKNPAP